jgi:hypothetical protein
LSAASHALESFLSRTAPSNQIFLRRIRFSLGFPEIQVRLVVGMLGVQFLIMQEPR